METNADKSKCDQVIPENYVEIDHCEGHDQPVAESLSNINDCEGDQLLIDEGNYEGIVLQIKSDMDKLCQESSSTPSIYKIPKILRETNKKAYTPSTVAIGPYHAENEELKPMEEHKLRYLKALVSRSMRSCCSCVDVTNKLKEYFRAVALKEPDARQCYSELKNLSHSDLTRMLLIDGAFIIEFVLRHFDGSDSFMDPMTNGKIGSDIRQDLILLENQIPFFILECLFELTPNKFSNEGRDPTLGEIVYRCLADVIPIQSISDLDLEELHTRIESSGEVLHLVHLMRICCLLPSPQQQLSKTGSYNFTIRKCCHPIYTYFCGVANGIQSVCSACCACLGVLLICCWRKKQKLHESILWRKPLDKNSRPLSATELHNAGIHFKQQEADRPSLDIEFFHGNVEMPCISVDDDTEIFLRNVMAFEQYHLHEYDITNYVAFLDSLIDTTKDVEILEKSEVIVVNLESRENVTMLFNSITHHTIIDTCQYYEVSKQLNYYAKKPRNKWMTMLHRNYFSTPWAIVSLVAAAILLILTAIQTVASVRSTKW